MSARRIVEWLLDLEATHTEGGVSVALKWDTPFPVWAIVLILGALVVWVVLIYRREGGPRWGRIVCGGLRLVLLLLTFALLLHPVLVRHRVRVEPSQVVLLVDDSASMATCDRDGAPKAPSTQTAPMNPTPAASPSSFPVGSTQTHRTSASAGRSRADQLKDALSADGWAALRAMAARNRLALYSFAHQAHLQAPPAGPDRLGPAKTWLAGFQPTGLQTNLSGALRDVLAEPRVGRLSAIVLASDGRRTMGPDLAEAAREAADRGVPVHTVLLGSTERRRDILVGPVLTEDTVFVRDPMAVRTDVSVEGFDAPITLTVELLGPDDKVLDQRVVSVGPPDDAATVELRYRPEQPGRLTMRVRVPPRADEVNAGNNTEVVEVDVVDEKIRVLYVEGYPRYEYRYLKNMLIREQTIVSSCLLLSADEGFVQEGTEPVRRFPGTAKELQPFDVIIFGDVDPRGDWLPDPQAEQLVKWVGDRGGGFVMIAGPRWSPQAFLGTALEPIIPVRIDPQATPDGQRPITTVFRPELTAEGRRSAVFRFEADPNSNETVLANLPGMYWFARTRGPRPGAEVLAEHPTVRTVDGPMPLVVTGRYGAGTTALVAVEETWRWRRDVGGVWFEAFWLQLIRHVTRHQLLGRDRRFVLQSDRPRYELGESVTLLLTGLDASEVATWPDRLYVEVTDMAARPVARVPLVRVGQGANLYEGTFVPPRAGGFVARVEPAFASPGRTPPALAIRVEAGGPELRRLEPDHEALRQLAKQTGGVAVEPADLHRIAERLDDRCIQIPDDVSEPLWDTKLVLAIFVLIIGSEWLLRKMLGMV